MVYFLRTSVLLAFMETLTAFIIVILADLLNNNNTALEKIESFFIFDIANIKNPLFFFQSSCLPFLF